MRVGIRSAFWILLLAFAGAGCSGEQFDIRERVATNAAHVSQTMATNHILVVDVSPSMAPYLPAVINGIENAIRTAGPEDILSVHIFWHEISTLAENVRLESVDREALIRQIRASITTNQGCTDVAKMLDFTKERMAASEAMFPFHRKMLLIFSDNQHAPFPCGGGKALTKTQITDLESKAVSVRRMGGWSKYVIYTPVVDKKEQSYNKLPSEIGAKRIEYTDYRDPNAIKNIVSVTKWILVLQMIAAFLVFLYFVFRLYSLSKLLFAAGLFLLVFVCSAFLVEVLSGIDYLNSSVELVTGQLINLVSPVVGDHRIVMPLQLTFSIMIYIGLIYVIKVLTRTKDRPVAPA